VRALISASGAVSYNNTTGVISLTSGNLTEATSSVLTITGGTGAVLGSGTSIQVKQASSSVSGFLSSTDWSTFNGKASALSGTTNYVAKFTSSTGIGNSQIFDNGTNVGIGTSSGSEKLNIFGAGSQYINIKNTTTSADMYVGMSSGLAAAYIGTGGTDPVVFVTVNTERLRITSAGLVAIGTASPASGRKLTVAGSVQITTGDNSGASFNIVPGATGQAGADLNLSYYTGTDFGPLTFTLAGSERMRITSAGNVGIGTSSVTASTNYRMLKIVGTNGGEFSLGTTSADTGYIYASAGDFVISTLTAIPLTFQTNQVNRMIIFANGNTAIGTVTDNGYKLYVSGTIYATGNITANSDLTLKKNLTIIDNPTDKLMQLNGYAYQWKSNDEHQYGVIAQEVEKILPYAVSTGNDGIKGVSYNQIIPVLIEAVKEQKTKIENLEILLASK
jgi:hypothetical protein